jgi:uncharacterized protein (TIGR02001 family)
VTTDYIFRGQSQNHGNPAFQGGLDYTHPSGVHLNVWGSNVKLVNGDDAHVELDWTAGYAKTLGKLTLDGGFIYYMYPGSTDSFHDDYYEFYGKGTYDFGFAQLQGSVYGSPNYTNDTGGSVYYVSNVTVPLFFMPANATFSAAGGYFTYLDDRKKNFSHDYWNWNAGFSFTVVGIGVDLRYYGVNLPKLEPFTVDTSEGTFAFSLSKTF